MVRLALGVVLIAVGVVWFFQGLGAIDGYGMSGHGEWMFFGVLLALFGAATLRGAWALRRGDSADR